MTGSFKSQPTPPAWRPRFSLGTLMLILVVCCFTAAAGRYLVLGLQRGTTTGRAYFVIAVLVLPMVLLVGMQAVYRVSRLVSQRRDRKK